LFLLIALAACGACKRAEEPTGSLLSQVEAGLSTRDARLTSYHLVGSTREGALEQAFEFFYRAPNRMRGVLPGARTFSYDGKSLYELVTAEKKLVVYENRLPPQKSAQYLTAVFTPFAPEGFRAPLLATKGMTAERLPDPRGPEAVQMRQESGSGEEHLASTLRLRWPALDFLSRTLTLSKTVEIRMDDERCEAALKLCVPTKVTSSSDGQPTSVTTLSRVELNIPLPADDFTLGAPEGYAVEHHQLVESGGPPDGGSLAP
jgi:outer membrane lipoprotein-sorting protein